jgi:hypothetical protein
MLPLPESDSPTAGAAFGQFLGIDLLAWTLLIGAAISGYVLCGILGIRSQRRHDTPNWQKAARLFPVPEEIRLRRGWRRAFVRDKPGGHLVEFRINAVENGVVIREHIPVGVAGIPRPRSMFVPWSRFSNPKTIRLPWHVCLEARDRIELGLPGLQVSVVVPRDVWQRHNPTECGTV